MPAVVGCTTVSTSSAVRTIIATAANLTPVDSVNVELRPEASIKSASIVAESSFNLGAAGGNPLSIVHIYSNVVASSVAIQPGSRDIQGAAVTSGMVDPDAVTAVFDEQNFEWIGSDPVAGTAPASAGVAGEFILADDMLEAIGKAWRS